MTLNTSFVINHPVNPWDVFTFARALVGADESITWEHTALEDSWRPNASYRNHAGQGLPAWVFVHYNPDGLLEDAYDEDQVEVIGTKPKDPPGFVEASFDTTYSYRDKFGGCGDLHARYVGALGQWCEDNDWPYWWQNEYTGSWFHDWRVAHRELVGSSDKARDWIQNIVFPAIELTRE